MRHHHVNADDGISPRQGEYQGKAARDENEETDEGKVTTLTTPTAPQTQNHLIDPHTHPHQKN